MNNTVTSSPTPRAGKKASQGPYGAQIAQTALQYVGGPTTDFPRTYKGTPEYAAAVSILFTKATNQTIMLGTDPGHVLSTSILCNSLLHDKRFKQVPMNEAAPGDIIIASGGNQAAGYTGIVVDHGRIVSMGRAGTVENNSSLIELQRTRLPMSLFRYIGVQKYPISPLANASYDPNEPRLPAGQSGGGQWTSGGGGGMQMAPSTTVLSGGNGQTLPGKKAPDTHTLDDVVDYLDEVAEVWKGYGDAITETVTGLWNAALHPIATAKGIAEGITHLVKDPVGTLKAIGQQIAADFTSGDPRRAGKLVGQVLIALAGTEFSAEKLASLVPKVVKAASGKTVSLTAEETGILQKALSSENSFVTKNEELISKPQAGSNIVTSDKGTQALTKGEVTSYQNFVDRSVVGDNLEGYELWQHANLNEHGLATTRLSTPASQNNPVIVLDKSTHAAVRTAQKTLNARVMTPAENIMANAQILRDLNAASPKAIDAAKNAALEHAGDYGY